MRLTQKKIEEIMRSVIGEEGLPLIEELSGRENVSEFELGDKLKKDIKIVRKMLYLLYNYNLVRFIRKKDKVKGWYIYYWTLLPESIKFNYVKRKKELLVKLQQRLDEESKESFFMCPNKCIRLNFDQSIDFEFHCSECGELTSPEDNAERLKTLQKKISGLETELEELSEKRKARKETVRAKKKQIKLRKREKRKRGKTSAKKKTKVKSKKTAKKKK